MAAGSRGACPVLQEGFLAVGKQQVLRGVDGAPISRCTGQLPETHHSHYNYHVQKGSYGRMTFSPLRGQEVGPTLNHSDLCLYYFPNKLGENGGF